MADIKPNALRARRDRALLALEQERDLAHNVNVLAILAADDDHPVTSDTHADALATLVETKRRNERIVKATGKTRAQFDKDNKYNRKREVKDRIERWTERRDIHEDMANNPDAYGGVDLGGTPIDVEEQRKFVKEYDAGIRVALDELASLG